MHTIHTVQKMSPAERENLIEIATQISAAITADPLIKVNEQDLNTLWAACVAMQILSNNRLNENQQKMFFTWANQGIAQDHPPAWNTLGLCHLHGWGTQLEKDKAFECFHAALKKDSSLSYAWNNLSMCHLEGWGTPINKEQAFKCLKVSCQKDPEYDHTWRLLGDSHFLGSGTKIDKEKAVKCYQTCLQKNPDNLSALFPLGYAHLFGVGTRIDENEAFKCCNKATQIAPDNANAWLCLGNCYDSFGGPTGKAQECFDKYKTLSNKSLPDSTASIENISITAPQLSNENSTQSGEKINSKDKEHPKTDSEEVLKLQSDQQLAPARMIVLANELSAFISANPDEKVSNQELQILYNTATLLNKSGHHLQSFILFKQAAEHGYAPAWGDLAHCHLKGLGTPIDYTAVFECHKTATQKDPNNAPAWVELGSCFMRALGTPINQKEAFNCYQAANQIDPNFAVAWQLLGACYKMGWGTECSLKNAQVCYDKYEELIPKNLSTSPETPLDEDVKSLLEKKDQEYQKILAEKLVSEKILAEKKLTQKIKLTDFLNNLLPVDQHLKENYQKPIEQLSQLLLGLDARIKNKPLSLSVITRYNFRLKHVSKKASCLNFISTEIIVLLEKLLNTNMNEPALLDNLLLTAKELKPKPQLKFNIEEKNRLECLFNAIPLELSSLMEAAKPNENLLAKLKNNATAFETLLTQSNQNLSMILAPDSSYAKTLKPRRLDIFKKNMTKNTQRTSMLIQFLKDIQINEEALFKLHEESFIEITENFYKRYTALQPKMQTALEKKDFSKASKLLQIAQVTSLARATIQQAAIIHQTLAEILQTQEMQLELLKTQLEDENKTVTNCSLLVLAQTEEQQNLAILLEAEKLKQLEKQTALKAKAPALAVENKLRMEKWAAQQAAYKAAKAEPEQVALIESNPAVMSQELKISPDLMFLYSPPKPATLEQITQLPRRLKVEDHLRVLKHLLQYEIKDHTATELLMQRNALLGTCALLMENYKNLEGYSVFDNEVARHFRNVVFHAPELIPAINLDLEFAKNVNAGIKNMALELLAYIQSKPTLGKTRDDLLVKIRSNLFQKIMTHKIADPDYNFCAAQLILGKGELKFYENHYNQYKTLYALALGFTHARLGSFTAIIRDNFKNEYFKLRRGYQKYIRLGNAYRHDDHTTRSSASSSASASAFNPELIDRSEQLAIQRSLADMDALIQRLGAQSATSTLRSDAMPFYPADQSVGSETHIPLLGDGSASSNSALRMDASPFYPTNSAENQENTPLLQQASLLNLYQLQAEQKPAEPIEPAPMGQSTSAQPA